MKVSLHKSGRWQFSFTSEFVQAMELKGQWDRGTRHMERWLRPPELGARTTLAFRINVPSSELRRMPIRSQEKRTKWIAAPPIGGAVEFAILLAARGDKITGWPGKRSIQTNLITQLPLSSGETLWVVSRETRVTSQLKSQIDHYRSVLREMNPGVDFNDPTIRALLGGSDTHGKYFIEIAMTVGEVDETKLGEAGPPGFVDAGLFGN